MIRTVADGGAGGRFCTAGIVHKRHRLDRLWYRDGHLGSSVWMLTKLKKAEDDKAKRKIKGRIALVMLLQLP